MTEQYRIERDRVPAGFPLQAAPEQTIIPGEHGPAASTAAAKALRRLREQERQDALDVERAEGEGMVSP